MHCAVFQSFSICAIAEKLCDHLTANNCTLILFSANGLGSHTVKMALKRKPCLSIRLLFMQCLLWQAYADVYMHNPRGSNNRLNENSANRRNNNRLFDSQVSL